MDPDRKTDMIRLPREEEVFEREAMLGRDAVSVFPTEANKDKLGNHSLEGMRGMIGGKKFISETELDSIRAQRSGTTEDGMVSADKPLAEILRENKRLKEEAFQERWKTMKQGGNRPLDEDEAQHFEDVLRNQATKDKEWSAQQRQELDSYRQAVQDNAASKESDGAGGPTHGAAAPSAKVAPLKRPAPVAKPLVFAVLKPKAAAGRPIAAAVGGGAGTSGRGLPGSAAAGEGGDPEANKKARHDEPGADGAVKGGLAAGTGLATTQVQGSGGLAALLGAYGVDSDDSDGAG